MAKIRIEKRPKPLVFDEYAIREAYLRGDKPARIVSRYPEPAHQTIHAFIRENREDWDEERERDGLIDCGTKIIIQRRITAGEWGGVAWMKISLPRISMFLAARMEPSLT